MQTEERGEGCWYELTDAEVAAFMLRNLHEEALRENAMTRRQRLDGWMRVRYFEARRAAGYPAKFEWTDGEVTK